MEQSENVDRIVQLEAEIDFLREIVRAMIARHPPDRIADGPLMAAIRDFNQNSEQLSESQKSARAKAWRNFRFENIPRMRG